MSEERNILTQSQVSQIIKRIAFEIYEHNFDEQKIVIVGIYDKGYHIAEKITSELSNIVGEMKIELVRLDIDKSNPAASDVQLEVASETLKNMAIVLVDDVLNTGKTMAYSLKALLEVEVKRLQVAVLVNRSHKLFPLSPNYMGYELSTTIDEHVEVRLGENAGVYLY